MSFTAESERLSMVASGCYPEFERPGDRAKIEAAIQRDEKRMRIASNPIGESVWVRIGGCTELFPQFPQISDFGPLQRIHPGHALTYLRTDRDEAGRRIGRVLGWGDGKMVAIREDGAAVDVTEGGKE